MSEIRGNYTLDRRGQIQIVAAIFAYRLPCLGNRLVASLSSTSSERSSGDATKSLRNGGVSAGCSICLMGNSCVIIKKLCSRGQSGKKEIQPIARLWWERRNHAKMDNWLAVLFTSRQHIKTLVSYFTHESLYYIHIHQFGSLETGITIQILGIYGLNIN